MVFPQALEIGEHVRRGEHGYPVVFWKWLEKGEESQDGEEPKSKRIPLARLYTITGQTPLPSLIVLVAAAAAVNATKMKGLVTGQPDRKGDEGGENCRGDAQCDPFQTGHISSYVICSMRATIRRS